MPLNIKPKEQATESYSPEGEEYEIQQYLMKRIPILKDARKNIL